MGAAIVILIVMRWRSVQLVGMGSGLVVEMVEGLVKMVAGLEQCLAAVRMVEGLEQCLATVKMVERRGCLQLWLQHLETVKRTQ